MANCPHCNRAANGPPLTKKCESCGSTWCANGNCTGTYNKINPTNRARGVSWPCPYCKKGKCFAI
jgi:hypothetical protein